ncbi:MAG: pseudaminic acid biosynthesis-associated methylase [Solirubrobacteraceae bacterium]
MSRDFRTEQEAFWAGAFGDEYSERNVGERLVAAKTALLARVLARTAGVATAIEFGANIGLNLIALTRLLPDVQLTAIEINVRAASRLAELGVEVHNSSILDFEPQTRYDLVLISGVLIHIAPDELLRVYDRLDSACGRYLCIVEYYNPTPVEVPYRGHRERLFKRDFAGEVLDRFDDLRLVDYGFAYHRDPVFPQDDGTWFLLERARA